MEYQAGGQRSRPRPAPESLRAQAYLQDYAALLEAVPFPSVVFDHRWDVVLTNDAFETLFRGVGPHPTAMYQLTFTPALFPRIVPFLALNRQGLTVLVHPETGRQRADHLAHALWLGAVLPLRAEVLPE